MVLWMKTTSATSQNWRGKSKTPHYSLLINVMEWCCHCPLMSWNGVVIAHYVMEWSRHYPLCWVQHRAHPNKVLKLTLYNKLTFHLTQHNNIIGKTSTIPQQIKKHSRRIGRFEVQQFHIPFYSWSELQLHLTNILQTQFKEVDNIYIYIFMLSITSFMKCSRLLKFGTKLKLIFFTIGK